MIESKEVIKSSSAKNAAIDYHLEFNIHQLLIVFYVKHTASIYAANNWILMAFTSRTSRVEYLCCYWRRGEMNIRSFYKRNNTTSPSHCLRTHVCLATVRHVSEVMHVVCRSVTSLSLFSAESNPCGLKRISQALIETVAIFCFHRFNLRE